MIAGADFVTTAVWTWLGLVTYDTAFVIDLASRRVHIVGSTPDPDERFMRQVARRMIAVYSSSMTTTSGGTRVSATISSTLYFQGGGPVAFVAANDSAASSTIAIALRDWDDHRVDASFH